MKTTNVIAAQSIGEPGIKHLYIHVGGTASKISDENELRLNSTVLE